MKGIFGPSQGEVWEKFAREVEGKYIEGGFFKAKKIETKFDNWTIIFDTYTQSSGKHSSVYTRIRIPYKTKEDFSFQMYSKRFFSGFGKALGMQDIGVGYKEFDEKFIIKGNDEKNLKELFKNERLRELLLTQNRINLEIKDNKRLFDKALPADVRQIYFYDMGLIKEEERLKNLYFLMVLLMEELARMGIAEREDPNVILK